MNYILSSIVLLAVIMIIIYILSIDNNTDKLKNKLKELFSVAKSPKINYLNEKDNKNLLIYIKQHFNNTDNITIPTKIYYNKTENGYEMKNINIICYNYNGKTFIETQQTINILFIPFEKENYISNQSLLGLHGNYMIEIINNKQVEKNVTFNDNDTFIPQPNNVNDNNQETYTDILDMIPDIIHLSEDNSELNTTDTAELISHNFK
jgi:hypothetical protein